MEDVSIDSPPVSDVREKLTAHTRNVLSMQPPVTSASIFRSSPARPEPPEQHVVAGGEVARGRARVLRSHYQKHYNDVHGILEASDPIPAPIPASAVADNSLSVFNGLQLPSSLNIFSYFIASRDSQDELDAGRSRSESQSTGPQDQARLLSPSPSTSAFATSPTYIVPVQTPPVAPRRPFGQQQQQRQQMDAHQGRPPVPRQASPSPSPVPAPDDLSWVPKLKQTQRMSPSQRREMFQAAQNHVDVTVNGLEGGGAATETDSALTPRRGSKSVLINLTPMKSYSEGGGLVGVPLTITPGAKLDVDRLLGAQASGTAGSVDLGGSPESDDDDDDDDDGSDTKVVVDFAINVFRDESHPGSSFPILSPRQNSMKRASGTIDDQSPGAVSSLISRFENLKSSSSQRDNTASTDAADIIEAIVDQSTSSGVAISEDSTAVSAAERQRLTLLETVSDKLSVVVEHLLASRRVSSSPGLENGAKQSDLFTNLSQTLAELRQTLTSREDATTEAASAGGGDAISGDRNSSSTLSADYRDAPVEMAEPENTQLGAADFLRGQVESLQVALDCERMAGQALASSLVEARTELEQALRKMVPPAVGDVSMQTDPPLLQTTCCTDMQTDAEPVEPPIVLQNADAQTDAPPQSSFAGVQTDSIVLAATHSTSVQTEQRILATIEMQTEPLPAVPVTATATSETQTQADDVRPNEELLRLRHSLLQSQQDQLEAALLLEEARLATDKQRAQFAFELGNARRTLEGDKESMDHLARDLEATFETLALTLIELSLEKEKI